MPKIKSDISGWFDYPDDPFHGKVNIRLPKTGELAAIRERTSEIRTEYIQEFRKKETTFRLNGMKVEIAKAAILGWENFLDEDGKELKCTHRNIEIMCLEDGFLEFIDSSMAVLENESVEKQKAEAKNS